MLIAVPVALPIAAGVLLLEWILPAHAIPLGDASVGTAIHMVSSVLAFGLLSIAGLYALFVFVIDHFLRRHHLSPLLRSLPPLEVLENLLFKFIAAGFMMLTISPLLKPVIPGSLGKDSSVDTTFAYSRYIGTRRSVTRVKNAIRPSTSSQPIAVIPL